ncbi:F-box and WD-40 domain protein MET30, partial [Phenoliferia sp. Uapishka_3]
MTSPPADLLPGDHLNFSFSPSSPPSLSSASFPSFPSLSITSPITPHPSYNPLDASTVSPALYAPSVHQHPLHPALHPHHGSNSESELSDEDMASDGSTHGAGKGKRTADIMMCEEEDEMRRGPPEADTPGGDCKSLCVRHQRMANGGTNLMLQKSIETLPQNDQTVVNAVWSLFSSSPSRRRLLILRGLLTIACPSQLSFLQDALTLEMRLDPIEVLPREVSLKVFGYLDAISLGRAAQVSKSWKSCADDDVLWRTMCEQHIERKCEKCGWGLPLLGEKRRKGRAGKNEQVAGGEPATRSNSTAPSRSVPTPALTTVIANELWQAASSEVASSSSHSMAVDPLSPAASAASTYIGRPFKRSKTESPAPSRSSTPVPGSPRSSSRNSSNSQVAAPSTRPWKSVYCERLAIERNWRRGTCVATVLSGHTDSITCLQVAEDLPHPNFPILMTGSWDRSVRIWNLESGKEVGVLRGHTRGVRALQFDAVKLVTGSMDSTLKIWNWRTGECMRTLRGHRDAVICLTYDKQLLVSGSADSTIRVWDFGTGEVYTLRGHTEWVNSVAIWNSNTACATSSGSGSTEGDLGTATNDPEQAKASSKGKFLVSASDDMTIRVWDLYTRECVRVLKGHVAQVQSLRVITADADDGAAFPPTVTTPQPQPSAENRHQVVDGNAYEGFFDAPVTSSTLPSCSTSTTPASFLATAQTQTGGPPGAAAFLHAAAMPAPDVGSLPDLDFAGEARPRIVSASLDNTIKVWDVEKGVCERTLFGHIEGVWDVDVDKLRIVSASHDRTLKIWDKDSGRCLHTLVGHTSAVTAITLQDQYVISGGDDGSARIWRFS